MLTNETSLSCFATSDEFKKSVKEVALKDGVLS